MTFTPGDILLVNDYSGGSDLIGNLIRAGERARYGDTDASRWTHCALIVSDSGDLVEALSNGVCRTNIRKYRSDQTQVIRPAGATPAQRPGSALSLSLAR